MFKKGDVVRLKRGRRIFINTGSFAMSLSSSDKIVFRVKECYDGLVTFYNLINKCYENDFELVPQWFV